MAHGHKFAKNPPITKILAISQNFSPPKLPAIQYINEYGHQ